jgi:hypothetical protein
MYKKILLSAFIVITIKSCVIDTIQRFCIVKNQSDRTIAIYFSNNINLDSTAFKRQFYDSSFAIIKYSTGNVLVDDDIFLKESYKNNNNRKLYAFFLDQDSINKYFQLPLSNNLIQKSLLKRQEVDIHNINSRDTLYYVE